ncbi:MAG: ATP-binding protein [Leifsonia sp.]
MTTAESRRLLASTSESRPPLSERRVTTALARWVGVFGLVFGLQTVPIQLAEMPFLRDPWDGVVSVVVFAGILAVAVTTILDRGWHMACAVFAWAYLVVVLVWPLLVQESTTPSEQTPWIWYLCTVATSCAAMAFRFEAAAIYTIVTPLCYGVIRALPAGGDVGVLRASLDALYAMILGAAVLIIVTSLRQAAVRVDAASAAALSRYAEAAREHAVEVERVEVDSIVHDSVLATLLAAASADDDRQRTLAVVMAQDALRKLEPDAAAAESGDVPLESVALRLQDVAGSFTPAIEVRRSGIAGRRVPSAVVEALIAASIQAMVNSMRHAGSHGEAVERAVSVVGTAAGCRVVVRDTGIGFAVEELPPERLGLRVSVIERMTSVGGTAEIRSSRGAGTVITLVWPAGEAGGAG